MAAVTKINEIFSSIQGEGLYIGSKQLFIRFGSCNLKCNYCDTDFRQGKNYSVYELYNYITDNYDLSSYNSITLTGGEPLVSVEFLKEFLPVIYGKTKIYLETNATLTENFEEIKTYIDIISADIKLMSATGYDTLALHRNFFEACTGKETFAKVVFDDNITENEIEFCSQMGKIHNMTLVLQPKMIKNELSISSESCNEILEKFTSIYPNVRLIPQVHKFLGVK